VAFLGHGRKRAQGAKNDPWVMAVPVLALAVLSLGAGFIPVENFLTAGGHGHVPLGITLGAQALAVLGLSLSSLLYRKKTEDPLIRTLGWFERAARRKFYFDELYGIVFLCPQELWCRALRSFERFGVSGATESLPEKTVVLLSRGVGKWQAGRLPLYLLFFVLGLTAALVWVLAG